MRENKNDINEAYALVCGSNVRNDLISEDIRSCVKNGRTPVVLTRFKEHAKTIYDKVQADADFVFILYGDNSSKENAEVIKRLKTYKKIGFQVMANADAEKQDANAIYDSGNYMDVFEQDLIEAEKEIIISSPRIIQDKINRLIYLAKPRQEAGVRMTVITQRPENAIYDNADFLQMLIEQMENAGIHVKTQDDVMEHFAVIDRSLVWHGGMNLLGKEDAWDNLLRVRDRKAAEELLEIAWS